MVRGVGGDGNAPACAAEDSGKAKAALEGVYVRSYEFAEDGEYSRADVESVRSQLQAPTWGRIVGVRSRRDHGDVDVFLKLPGNGTLGGAVIIVAEPRQLTFVNVVGSIDPDDVASLGGQFHIPKLHGSHSLKSQEDK